MPNELLSLFQRYNQLGRLLPQSQLDQEVALQNKRERAGLRVILAEMRKVKAEIDRVLDQHRVRP